LAPMSGDLRLIRAILFGMAPIRFREHHQHHGIGSTEFAADSSPSDRLRYWLRNHRTRTGDTALRFIHHAFDALPPRGSARGSRKAPLPVQMDANAEQCLLQGVKRTSLIRSPMSANDPYLLTLAWSLEAGLGGARNRDVVYVVRKAQTGHSIPLRWWVIIERAMLASVQVRI
jgi:hypothetical protein